MLTLALSLLAGCDGSTEASPEPAPAPEPTAAPAPPAKSEPVSLGCPDAEAMTEPCANRLYKTLSERIGEAETSLTPLPADAGDYPPTAGFYPDAISTPEALTSHLHPVATDGLIESWMKSGTATIQGKIAVDVEGCGGPGFLVIPAGDGWAVVADVDEADRGEGDPIAFSRGDDGVWRIDGTALPVGVACGGPASPM